MKRGTVITVLISLVVLGCGQQQQRLKVTYSSDPPGGTLYKQNGELWGPCPKVLWYDLNEEALAAGQLKAKGLVVRWPTGAEKRSDNMITFPIDGNDQQFTFVQSGDAPADQHIPGQTDQRTAAVPRVKSERDDGLHEEPDERTVATTETIKTKVPVNGATQQQVDAIPTESVDDAASKQAEVVQTKSVQEPGLREEPEKPNATTTETGNIAGAKNPKDGIIEEQAGARSESDPDKSTQDGQTSVPKPKPTLIPRAPEDPNEKSIRVKTKSTNVDFGNGVKMDFAEIPPGEFTMGSGLDENGDNSVKNPTQRVRISKSFWIGVYEVTQEQYEKVMSMNPSRFVDPNRPVERVSWKDAQMFCERLSGTGKGGCRLPTEAEWEYACRAETETAYYWGDNFDSRYALTIADLTITDRPAGTDNVGTRLRNAWGLYDMSGNVWEWCSDPYIDPGPPTRTFRVLRGGSWASSQRNCRSAHRNWHTENHRYDDCGFRIVLEMEQPSVGAVETPLP